MPSKTYFYAIGRRKTARATVKLFLDGTGTIKVNDTELRKWCDTEAQYKHAVKPFDVLENKKLYDVEARVSGGGKTAQADSLRLAVARALYLHDSSYREQLKAFGLLTRDPRIKERKKPGLKRARRAPQFSKR